MLLFDYYTNRKYSWKMLIEKIPFFTIALIFGVGAIYSQKTTGAIQNMAPTLTFIEHISVISWAFLGYLYRAFIPINQSAIYPYPMEIGSTLPIMYYISILIVALLLAFVWYSRKWGKEIVFGFLFFIATIILVLQFIPVGAAIMADRYTYIPYIGIFFIVAKIFERLSSLESSKINYKQYSLVVLALGFLAFAVIAFERVKVWETEETLFTDVIAKYPKCSIAHLNRGNYYKDYFAKVVYANDTTKKNAYLRKSIIDFENSLKCILMKAERAKGYCNLGDTKMQLGDWTGAKSEFDDGIYTDSVVAGTEAYFLRAFANQQLKNYLAAFSDYNKAIISNPNNTGDKNTQSYTNCGVINNILNDYSSAIKNFDKALLLNPNYGDAYSYRAFSKFQLGNFKDAIVDYDKAIALTANEKNAENYTNKGIAENNLKDYTTAVTDFDKALAIDVNYANAYTNRGCSKFYLKDYQGALDDYKKVNQLNPGDVNAIKNIEITSKLLGNKPPSPLYVTY